MDETNCIIKNETNDQQGFTVKIGNTDFIVGIKFKDCATETLEEKVKRMIVEEIKKS